MEPSKPRDTPLLNVEPANHVSPLGHGEREMVHIYIYIYIHRYIDTYIDIYIYIRMFISYLPAVPKGYRGVPLEEPPNSMERRPGFHGHRKDMFRFFRG